MPASVAHSNHRIGSRIDSAWSHTKSLQSEKRQDAPALNNVPPMMQAATAFPRSRRGSFAQLRRNMRCTGPLEERLAVPTAADRIHDIRARFPLGEHLQDHRGRILQVGFEAARPILGEALNLVPSPVPTAVVHQHDFDRRVATQLDAARRCGNASASLKQGMTNEIKASVCDAARVSMRAFVAVIRQSTAST